MSVPLPSYTHLSITIRTHVSQSCTPNFSSGSFSVFCYFPFVCLCRHLPLSLFHTDPEVPPLMFNIISCVTGASYEFNTQYLCITCTVNSHKCTNINTCLRRRWTMLGPIFAARPTAVSKRAADGSPIKKATVISTVMRHLR